MNIVTGSELNNYSSIPTINKHSSLFHHIWIISEVQSSSYPMSRLFNQLQITRALKVTFGLQLVLTKIACSHYSLPTFTVALCFSTFKHLLMAVEVPYISDMNFCHRRYNSVTPVQIA
jgi:muramoyltetrapeptide carboxypeptidase LdcA involved in peptidoglycan recycling